MSSSRQQQQNVAQATKLQQQQIAEFPLAQQILAIPSKRPLDPNSNNVGVIKLITLLQTFFPHGDHSTWPSEAQVSLMTTRTAVFELLIEQLIGPQLFFSGKGDANNFKMMYDTVRFSSYFV